MLITKWKFDLHRIWTPDFLNSDRTKTQLTFALAYLATSLVGGSMNKYTYNKMLDNVLNSSFLFCFFSNDVNKKALIHLVTSILSH